MSALTLGTYLHGQFFGKIKNNASTPTLEFKVVLRNASTGAVAYTLTDHTVTMVSTASDTGLILEFGIQVSSVGTAGSISAWDQMGSAGWTGTTLMQAPTITSVNTQLSYLLDASLTWGTSHANNALVLYGGYIRLIG
jgi:hypothetical protein